MKLLIALVCLSTLSLALSSPAESKTPQKSAGNNAGTTKAGGPPSYAVPMEPLTKYSQPDPLFGEGKTKSKAAESKKGDLVRVKKEDSHLGNVGHVPQISSKVGLALPYAASGYDAGQTQHHHHQLAYGAGDDAYYDSHYPQEPEPIIEIIIKESNQSLPAPPPPPPPPKKKKKEPVQVYYVKYKKEPSSHYGGEKIVYEPPVPAITPPTNNDNGHEEEEEEEVEDYHHHQEPVTLPPRPSTTLKAIIRPDSETYHGPGLHITFGEPKPEERGTDHHHTGGDYEEQSAPQPSVLLPPQSKNHLPLNPNPSPQPSTVHHSNPHASPIPNTHVSPVPNPHVSPLPNLNLNLNADSQLKKRNPAPFQSQSIPPQQSFHSVPSFSPGPNDFYRSTAAPPFQQTPRFSAQPQQFSPNVQFPNVQPSLPPPSQSSTSHRQGTALRYTTLPQFQQFPKSQSSFSFPPSRSPSPQPPPQQPIPQQSIQSQQLYSINQPHLKSSFNLNSRSTPQPYHTISNRVTQHGFPKAQSLSPSPSVPTFQQPTKQPVPQPPRQFPKPVHSFPPPPPPSFPQPNQHAFPQPSFPQPQRPLGPPLPPPRSQNVPPPPVPVHHSNGPISPPVLPQSRHPQLRPQHQQELEQFNRQRQLEQQQQLHFQQQQQQQQQRQQQLELFHQQQRQKQIDQLNQIQRQQHLEQVHKQQQSEHFQRQQKVEHQQHLEQLNNFQRQQFEQFNFLQRQQQEQLNQIQRQKQQLEQLNQLQRQQQQLNQLQQQQFFSSQSSQNFQKQNFVSQPSSKSPYEPEIIKSISPDLPFQSHRFDLKLQSQSTTKPQNFVQNYQTVKTSTQQYTTVTKTTAATTESTPKKETKQTQPPTTIEYATEDPKKVEEEKRKKEERKKQNVAALPDEVPEDLRQQLLSSDILGNADIQILDYDKIGDIPIDKLPPEALANFQAVAGSAPVPAVAKPDQEDEIVAEGSEQHGVAVAPPSDAMEMKVVRYNPDSKEGAQLASQYMKEGATQLEPVVLNDSRYNRYLPLKVSGAQFPVPDVPELRGKNVTSVVVLAPVDYEFLQRHEDGGATAATADEGRSGRSHSVLEVQGVHFVSGDILKTLVKRPTADNYNLWLEKENRTAVDKQSVVLLVVDPKNGGNVNGTVPTEAQKEIFMYDIGTKRISKLNGELSAQFVMVAESNSENDDLDDISDNQRGSFTVKDAAELPSPVQVRTERQAADTALRTDNNNNKTNSVAPR